MLGLGRGNSALTQIGRRPVHPGELKRALAEIQGLVRGEEVELERPRWAVEIARAAAVEREVSIGAVVKVAVVVPGSLDADPADVDASNERFAAEVLPGLC